MELNKVYKMDALEGCSKLDSNSINLVLTDPPYNITDNEWDKFSDSDFMLFTELWLNECYRLCRGGYLLMFWSPQKICLLYKLHTKWKMKRIVVWYMPNAPIHCQDGLIFTWQPIIIFEKEGEKTVNNGQYFISNDVRVHNFKEKERFGHPTIKPLSLISELVEKYSEEGALVLDPFMGSGTTAVACKMLRRKYIGFELNDDYLSIIDARLAQTKERMKIQDFQNNEVSPCPAPTPE